MTGRWIACTIAASAVVAVTWSALALRSDAFQGKPSFKPGKVHGMFTWAGPDDRVTICATSDGTSRTYSGRVDAMLIDSLRRLEFEPDDRAVLADKSTMRFQLTVDGDQDCVMFNAGGPGVRFRFEVGGLPLETERIFVGAKGVHPRDNPFSMNRR